MSHLSWSSIDSSAASKSSKKASLKSSISAGFGCKEMWLNYQHYARHYHHCLLQRKYHIHISCTRIHSENDDKVTIIIFIICNFYPYKSSKCNSFIHSLSIKVEKKKKMNNLLLWTGMIGGFYFCQVFSVSALLYTYPLKRKKVNES